MERLPLALQAITWLQVSILGCFDECETVDWKKVNDHVVDVGKEATKEK